MKILPPHETLARCTPNLSFAFHALAFVLPPSADAQIATRIPTRSDLEQALTSDRYGFPCQDADPDDDCLPVDIRAVRVRNERCKAIPWDAQRMYRSGVRKVVFCTFEAGEIITPRRPEPSIWRQESETFQLIERDAKCGKRYPNDADALCYSRWGVAPPAR